jgi:hypothetical protein
VSQWTGLGANSSSAGPLPVSHPGKEKSVHGSGGEALLIVAGLSDLLICFKGYCTEGSNPPAKGARMILCRTARRVVGRFLGDVHRVMCCWVVRAALLALGVWCAYPQPHTHSFIIRAGDHRLG